MAVFDSPGNAPVKSDLISTDFLSPGGSGRMLLSIAPGLYFKKGKLLPGNSEQTFPAAGLSQCTVFGTYLLRLICSHNLLNCKGMYFICRFRCVVTVHIAQHLVY